jgi:hypothetical protein
MVEGTTVEVAAMDVVVEAAFEVETMRRRGNQSNKIGEVEDMVMGEAADQINQILSATTVASRDTMKKSTNQMLSATTAASMGTTQNNAILRKKWKKM